MKILAKKRRRAYKTSYLKRKRLLEGRKPRIVLRKTNQYIILQYVESEQAKDKVKHTMSSRELMKYGWPKEKQGSLKNLTACYLAGLLFGNKIKEKDKEAIVDMGLIRSTKGSRIYAAIKGIVDAGVNLKHNPKMFPKEDRLVKENIKDIFEAVKTKMGGSK